MNIEQMIEKGVDALVACPTTAFRDQSRAVVDAILPQVAAVEELEALPPGTILLTERGELVQSLRRFTGHPVYWFEFIDGIWRGGELRSDGLLAAARGPLTVVYQP